MVRQTDLHPCLSELVESGHPHKSAAVDQLHRVAGSCRLGCLAVSQDQKRVVLMGGGSPPAYDNLLSVGHRYPLRGTLHGMPAIEGHEVIVPADKIQICRECPVEINLLIRVIVYDGRPRDDIQLRKNPIQKLDPQLCLRVPERDHQCLHPVRICVCIHGRKLRKTVLSIPDFIGVEAQITPRLPALRLNH